MRASAFALAAALVAASTPAFAQKRPPADPPSAPKVEHNEDLNLAVGENKTIPAVDVKNYSEGAAGIADIKLSTDGTQFVVVGQKPGSTTLLLIKKDGSVTSWTINVFARSPATVEREIEQLLEGTTGVRVHRVGSRFFLEGGVSSESDLKRMQQIATLYPGQVESLVVMGSAAPERKFNIRIDFFFVQYDKTSSYGFGISWPSTIGGPNVLQNNLTYDFVAGTTVSAQASIVNQPLPGLDIASQKGWAKVLKQATVITTNGSEATFDSGGEQNFPVTSGLVASIQRIIFGTNVTVLPRFNSVTRDLEIMVKADVADLVPPLSSATPLPGRDTSKLSTLVRMKLGQSVVLSGIRTSSARKNTSGIPWLSDIPVLGVLFGTTSYQDQEIEGAIFIIPSIVESATSGSVEMVKSARAQFEEYRGDFGTVRAFDKNPPTHGQAPPIPAAPGTAGATGATAP